MIYIVVFPNRLCCKLLRQLPTGECSGGCELPEGMHDCLHCMCLKVWNDFPVWCMLGQQTQRGNSGWRQGLPFAHTGFLSPPLLPRCCCFGISAYIGFISVCLRRKQHLNTKRQIHQYSPQWCLYLLCFRPLQGGNHYMTRADPMLTVPLLWIQPWNVNTTYLN